MNDKLNGLSLFSGIGGIELGLNQWVKTIAYCEIDPYAQAVLKSRMADTAGLRHLDSQAPKHPAEGGFSPQREPGSCCLDLAPIFPDITKLTAADLPHPIDIITGGFPCQDISNAGKRAGIQGKRSGLWFEMHRLIGELRPRYVFVENVSALLNRGLPEVLASLAEIGYDAIWTSIRASDVGAPHRRERVFILAYPTRNGRLEERHQTGELGKTLREASTGQPCGTSGLGNTNDKRQQELCGTKPISEIISRQAEGFGLERSGCYQGNWEQDPADLDPSSISYVGRVADGIPNRVDRIKCLGNAVVPQQAHEAFIRLMQTKEEIK